MKILDQPHDVELGEELEQLLGSGEFESLYIMAAYAKQSGASRIQPFLDDFRDGDGTVSTIVGIDQKGTTIQALEILLPVCDHFYVYHSESFTQTFHPKVYALEKSGDKAILFVGSNNLTSGGLYTNYEIYSKYEFDLTDDGEGGLFSEFKDIFTQYSDTDSELCSELDQSKIDELMDEGYLADESSAREEISRRAAAAESRDRLFGSESFAPPPSETTVVSDDEVPELPDDGDGFWKKLSGNDVSLSSSPGQIIIPKKFLGYFPALTDWDVMESDARQADMFFDVIFQNAEGDQTRVGNARVIHYVPSPDHARPNDEVRFTFRERNILNQLNEDDILVFRETEDPGIWFVIEHIPTNSDDWDDFAYRRYDSL